MPGECSTDPLRPEWRPPASQRPDAPRLAAQTLRTPAYPSARRVGAREAMRRGGERLAAGSSDPARASWGSVRLSGTPEGLKAGLAEPPAHPRGGPADLARHGSWGQCWAKRGCTNARRLTWPEQIGELRSLPRPGTPTRASQRRFVRSAGGTAEPCLALRRKGAGDDTHKRRQHHPPIIAVTG